MTFHLPDLPYPEDALAPVLSAETLQLHHGKHHRGYFDKLNALVEDRDIGTSTLEDLVRQADGKLFENAAQAWNHDFYWKGMAPGGSEMPSELKAAVESVFGRVESLRDRFLEEAAGHFGSGWAWIVQGADERLEITTTHDADTPLAHGRAPLLACDVWEHAYYVDYRNDRKAYLKAWWSLVDWNFVARNLVVAEQRTPSGDPAVV